MVDIDFSITFNRKVRLDVKSTTLESCMNVLTAVQGPKAFVPCVAWEMEQINFVDNKF